MNLAAVAEKHIYLPQKGRIIEARDMTEREKYFKIELETPLNHEPGQFVMVSVFGVGEAPISISCGPRGDNLLEMVIRKTGRLTTVFHELGVGDIMGIRGPYGCGFDLENFYGKDVLFVAGGLGLAPLRSLIDPVVDQIHRFGAVTLISGCRSPAEELYRDHLSRWSAVEGMTVIRTVDATRSMPWGGEVGLVTAPIPRLELDPANTVVALCGPPVMYKFVIMGLNARGVPLENIFVDFERRMKCGLGKCGHCQINEIYCCQEGPVFLFSEIKERKEALQ